MAIIGIRCAISQVAWVCRRSWRWNPPYSGQVVVVDGGIEDGAKQRQVGVHRPGCKALADHRRLPRPMVLGSRSASGMSSKGRRMHVSTFLRAPYSELGCWCWSFQAGRHLVVTYSPNRVRALTGSGSVGWECLAALALEGPPLGLGAHGG
jgi:hypothetical protein